MTEHAAGRDNMSLDLGDNHRHNASQEYVPGGDTDRNPSAISSATNIKLFQNKAVIVQDRYQKDLLRRAIEQSGVYDQAESEEGKAVVWMGNAYDEPAKEVFRTGGLRRNEPRQGMQSHSVLQPHMELSSKDFYRMRNEPPNENFEGRQRGQTAHFTSIESPSERSMTVLKGTKKVSPRVKVNDADENVTEFTEQFDNESHKIELESHKSIEQIGDGGGSRCGEDDTVMADDSMDGSIDRANSSLRIIKHGSVTIKYASSNEPSERPDSMNDRC